MLFVLTQAVAAAHGKESTGTTSVTKKSTSLRASSLTLERKLELKVKAAHRHRSTIRFLETHRSLLRTGDQRTAAVAKLRRAKRGLARATKEARYYKRLIAAGDTERQARRLASAPPRVAICEVFGQYCRQALAVAWCESGHQTTARNGQYLGLFQMGYYERKQSGHGDSAYEQARAAYRYFVQSGRDWSPWSCRWAAS